jgi:hypothetical protein
MNWYKRSQVVDTTELEWDKTVHELRRKLGRQPTAEEVQNKLYEKYWNLIDVPQPKQLELF